MKYIIFISIFICLTVPSHAFEQVYIPYQYGQLKYSYYYDKLICARQNTLEFLSPVDYTISKSINVPNLSKYSICSETVIVSNRLWGPYISELYKVDYDTGTVEYVYTSPKPIVALTLCNSEEAAIIYEYYPGKTDPIDSYNDWRYHPDGGRLAIININTGLLVEEYVIYPHSYWLVNLGNGIIAAGSEGLDAGEGVGKLIDRNNCTVENIQLFKGAMNLGGATIAGEPYIIRFQGAWPTLPETDPIVLYSIEPFGIACSYPISVPGLDCHVIGYGHSIVTDSNNLYTLLYCASTIEGNWVWDANKYLCRMDLATGNYEITEFDYDDQLRTMTVKEGNPNKVFILSDNQELLVFEM